MTFDEYVNADNKNKMINLNKKVQVIIYKSAKIQQDLSHKIESRSYTLYIFDRHNCLSRNKSLLNFPFPHFKMTKIAGNKKINSFLHYQITKNHFTKKSRNS